MGRRPIGERAMTAMERQQRRRDRQRARLMAVNAGIEPQGEVSARQQNRELQAELARLQGAGVFFDLLNDTPEAIARAIIAHVPHAKAGDIASLLSQFVRNRTRAM